MPADNTYVSRVTQIDAIALDKEVIQLLKTQTGNIVKTFHGTFLDRLEPEINLFLRFCIWKFSVQQNYSTFGQQLLNLKYEGDVVKYKSYAWGILTILPAYLKDRLGFESASHRKVAKYDLICRTVHWINIILRVAILANLLRFLKDGKYPSLIERILQMRLVPATKQQRTLGYSYMTRELMWHTLIEILGNLIPLINYYSLQRRIVSIFSKPPKHIFNRKPVTFEPGDKCAVCNETPILPHHMGCSHVYCFYCIQGNLLADKNFECPACGFCSEDAVANPVPHTKTLNEVL